MDLNLSNSWWYPYIWIQWRGCSHFSWVWSPSNIIQGNSEWMVQKENTAVTAVMNLFHKYKYNMKGKLSKFRRTFTDVRCGRPLWHGRRQHDSLVLATPMPAYPDQLSRPRPLSAALAAVKSCGSGGTNTLSFTYPQKKKSQGIRSGDLGGQNISGTSFGPARPIQRCGAPSCCKMKLGTSSSNWCNNHSDSMSR
jgi:hypothetical protein